MKQLAVLLGEAFSEGAAPYAAAEQGETPFTLGGQRALAEWLQARGVRVGALEAPPNRKEGSP